MKRSSTVSHPPTRHPSAWRERRGASSSTRAAATRSRSSRWSIPTRRVPDSVTVPLDDLAAGRFDQAVARYRAALAKAPDDPAWAEPRFAGIGDGLLVEGDIASAILVFRVGVALRPDSMRARPARPGIRSRRRSRQGHRGVSRRPRVRGARHDARRGCKGGAPRHGPREAEGPRRGALIGAHSPASPGDACAHSAAGAALALGAAAARAAAARTS
jgi:hypothetical protein